jgi:REP-associated tyrosine transposase
MWDDDVRVYRRRLPHFRLDGATYFVTWRPERGRTDLEPAERDEVAQSLCRIDGERYELHAFVVMNDHVHLVVTPNPKVPLERLVQAWKSSTAHRLPKAPSGRLWQSEYQDRIIRNEHEMRQKVEYVLNNPFARWPNLTFYPWVWASGEDDE